MIFVDNTSLEWVEVPDRLPEIFPVISAPAFAYFQVMPMSLAHEATFRHEHPIFGKLSSAFKPEYVLRAERLRLAEFLGTPQRWYGLRDKQWAEFTSFSTLGQPPSGFEQLVAELWEEVPKRRANHEKPLWGTPWFSDQFGRQVFGYDKPIDWSKYSEKLRSEQLAFYEQTKKLYNVSNVWIDANDSIFQSLFPKERK